MPCLAPYPDRQFEARQIIHDQILENAKSGDVIAVSRLCLQREVPIVLMPDIDPWIAQVAVLADLLQERKLALVVIGPTPMFAFKDIRECDIDDHNSCSMSRPALATTIGTVMEKLNRLRREHKNVFVFDTFSNVCPKNTDSCYSSRNQTFMYRDRDHLNSFGAKLLDHIAYH